MAWSDDDFIVAFDAEAGDIASLAVAASKIQWFNEGQERLNQWHPDFVDVAWQGGDRSVDLPADFVELSAVVYDEGAMVQDWRVWGQTLVIDDSNGATGAGSARVFYWAEFAPMTVATLATQLSRAQDFACLYYALHRFFKRLSSNRAFYKRYATLVGQNAVTMSDLQQESDRYYQDFLDAREDLKPEPPAFHYGRTR